MTKTEHGRIPGAKSRADQSIVHGSIILPTDGNTTDLQRRLEELAAQFNDRLVETIVVCPIRYQMTINHFLGSVGWSRPLFLYTPREQESLRRCIAAVDAFFVACIPPGGTVPHFQWPIEASNTKSIRPLISGFSLPIEGAVGSPIAPVGWIASRTALQELPANFEPRWWTFDEIARAYCASRAPVRILSTRMPSDDDDAAVATFDNQFSIRNNAKVLVIIPHYRCENWLEECLWSIVNQTRPADGIVVVDDYSPEPPIDLVRQYPDVTLLTTDSNVGPYQILQAVVDTTRYDAYMFQDADDWSMHDRLEHLLETAVQRSADLVGTQEMRVFVDRVPAAQVVAYPSDVNRALFSRVAHALQHPTSLVTRHFVQEMGGYASGLRFGGDTEFLLRARFTGRIANTSTVSYVRRMRSDSLTGSPETGFNSIARKNLFRALMAREDSNAAALRDGRRPRITPMAVGAGAVLRHLVGPRLLL